MLKLLKPHFLSDSRYPKIRFWFGSVTNFHFLLGNVSTECFDPSLAGTMVPPHTRRAGRYLLGPRLGVSPVKSIVQCLARLENTDQYFQVKLLTIFSGMGRNPREESQDEKQGKVRIILS